MFNSPRIDPRGVPSGISRDEQMKLAPVNAAFAAPVDVASPSAVIDRAGLQRLVTRLQSCAGEYGLKERHIAVLAMLASFVQQLTADGRPVVFASNRTMSARAHNMDIQRLQRVFRDLLRGGWILRQSSPNGKRYAHRNLGGQITDAYGIDLSPLIQRAAEIEEACRIVTERQLRIRLLRDRISVLRRAFPETAPEQTLIRAILRRTSETAQTLKEALAELSRRANDLADQKATARDLPLRNTFKPTTETAPNEPEEPVEDQSIGDSPVQLSLVPNDPILLAPCPTLSSRIIQRVSDTTDLTPNACQNDAHYQSQKQNIFDKKKASFEKPAHSDHVEPTCAGEVQPIDLVMACPEAMSFTSEHPMSWEQLQRLAWTLAPMIGISPSLAERALQKLGFVGFAISILGLVQRFSSQNRDHIRVPAAYLTSILSDSSHTFSPTRFLRALVSAANMPIRNAGAVNFR